MNSDEELSDLVNESEDYSGEPMEATSISVTELFTLFSPRELLFGSWTNINFRY